MEEKLLTELKPGDTFRYINGGDNWYLVTEVTEDLVKYGRPGCHIAQSNSRIHGTIYVEVAIKEFA